MVDGREKIYFIGMYVASYSRQEVNQKVKKGEKDMKMLFENNTAADRERQVIIARRMLLKGYDDYMLIASISDLPIDEIDRIRRELAGDL